MLSEALEPFELLVCSQPTQEGKDIVITPAILTDALRATSIMHLHGPYVCSYDHYSWKREIAYINESHINYLGFLGIWYDSHKGGAGNEGISNPCLKCWCGHIAGGPSHFSQTVWLSI